jgi:protease-4
MDTNEQNWERGVLERLALESIAEQKRRRRWNIFFKLLGFAYLAVLLALLVDWEDSADKLADGKPHTAVIDVDGIITSSSVASAENVTKALRKAFEDKHTRGVVLRINSPGGSPVQSGMINDEIRRLRAKYPDIPIYAVVEDLCASGGYYVATAADRIYVDKASIVGSIGVLMDGFGFTGTMDKLGIERRLLTAGENKGFLDPFSPQDTKQLEHAKVLLGDIHQQFIGVVRQGRGKRLKESPELFSGLMWTGSRAVELGLADDLGNVAQVARDVIKAETLKDFTVIESLTDRLARHLGTGMGEALNTLFARFSLR